MKYSLATVITVLAAVTSAIPEPSHSAAHSEAYDTLVELESRATTCSKAATDKLIFKTSIGSFQKARKAKNPSKCVWSSDNCSKSPDKPDGYNFIPSCQRHDFGYRNTKKQKRFTKAMKKRIDDNFKHDLYNYCSQFSGWSSWKGVECRRIADTYYFAVRQFGKRNVEFNSETQSYQKRDVEFEEELDDFDLDADVEARAVSEIEEGDFEEGDFEDLEPLVEAREEEFDDDLEEQELSEIQDDEEEDADVEAGSYEKREEEFEEVDNDIEGEELEEAEDGEYDDSDAEGQSFEKRDAEFEDFEESEIDNDTEGDDFESEIQANEKRSDEFDDFDGSELDPDIEGQEIPEIVDGEGEDIEDLEELSSE